MSFWSWLKGDISPPPASPGDPAGVEVNIEETYQERSLPFPMPTSWDGVPEGWQMDWNNANLKLRKLIDTAWACIDTNARVLSGFPVYRMSNGAIRTPKQWMLSPDPLMYASWNEFAKQLFWDYLLGEAFIMSMAEGTDGLPSHMRVIPPWCINAEIVGGTRVYNIGSEDVTNRILHLRYTSTTDDARGHGPLEVAGARMTTAALLQKYAGKLAETGGVPHYWLGVQQWLNPQEAEELLDSWVATRKRHIGEPGVVGGGASLNQTNQMSAKEMALLEIAQFTESRIAVLLGVPPFLVGLPSGGDSMTYSNVESLFDYHDRAMLKPVAATVMAGLSNWALEPGNSVELNRDEYTRPGFNERATGWKTLHEIGAVDAEFVARAERFIDSGADNSKMAAGQLTGMQATQTDGPTRAPAPTERINQ